TAVNFTLRGLILRAYELQQSGDRLIGGPAWAGSDRFDIEAKAEGDPLSSEMQLMVRALLADRFKLVMHTENRVLPIYELVMARSDSKAGPQLKPFSEANCVTIPVSRSPISHDRSHPPCGILYSPAGYWTGRRVSIDSLANVLTRVVGRAVVN